MSNSFLVSAFYHDGSCASNNLFAFGFKPFPSCATTPSNLLNGTCEFTGGKQMPNDYTSNLCVKDDYDFLGQMTKTVAGQDYVMIQGFDNDATCMDRTKVSSYYSLVFNKGINIPNVPIEDWSPEGFQFSRITGDSTKVSLKGRDGKEIKTIPVNTCISYGSTSYILAFPEAILTPTSATKASAAPVTTAVNYGATTTPRNINSGAASIAAGAFAFLAALII
ncbi:hypothetical protein BCR33DRAFT_716568 [Rhizoclosmatium globosum]|uniref:Uncharacterized protein n=1 Tax=Rhizoclosmatium globosum TaxID=329046 RepID=A0A1Y2CE16_9FUNG|nr:hypothetical protein BCR33DRAFT_716568 [Rhizoclosmatium globosum]|eukprot:ORY45283.1 hypothetical protein BCR33DRAFT_716568 [Rhizoclosmatium globosum]